MSLHKKSFFLKHKSHDLFTPPRIVEAILQFRMIMNSNSLQHASEHANQQHHWVFFELLFGEMSMLLDGFKVADVKGDFWASKNGSAPVMFRNPSDRAFCMLPIQCSGNFISLWTACSTTHGIVLWTWVRQFLLFFTEEGKDSGSWVNLSISPWSDSSIRVGTFFLRPSFSRRFCHVKQQILKTKGRVLHTALY